MKNNPFVSIIIPCYQEEKFIKKCLDSLINNNYPELEILVYDGKSTDKTRKIVKEFENKYSFVKLKDNPKKNQVFALNKGIKESRGEIIIRCDAHAEYSKNYIEKIVSWLKKDDSIGNVGGVWINKPSKNTLKAESIAFSLAHNFCVGTNKYRTNVKKPKKVDTVPFGAWRKEIFEKVGLFNEKFLRAQDLELNMRIKKAGYKIILDPEIKVYYYCRDSFKKLYKMFFQYGYWKVILNKELKILSSFRQLVPPLFLLYLFLSIFLSFYSLWVWLPFLVYLLMSFLFSLQICFKKKNIKLFFFNILTFFISHTGYGLGYLKGLIDFFKKDFTKKETKITR